MFSLSTEEEEKEKEDDIGVVGSRACGRYPSERFFPVSLIIQIF